MLEKRAYITANIFLEADELSAVALGKYQKKYIQSLSGEIISIYDKSNNSVFVENTEDLIIKDEIVNNIRSQKKIFYTEGDRQFAGIYYHDNQGDFVIIASAVDVAGIKKIDNLLVILSITFIISVFVTFIAGRLFVYQGLLPIKGVISQMSAIHANSLFVRVNEGKGKDEISDLAKSFNQMLDRLEEAFDMQKTFVTNASHELRTPITSISGELEFALMKERDAEQYKSALSSMKEEVDKLSLITESLLNYAKASFDISKITLKAERIDDLVQNSRDGLQKIFPGRKVGINISDIKEEKNLMILGNAQLLIISFKNVLENALKFSDETDRVSIQISTEGDYVKVIIKDTGIGISKDDIKNVFVTFFRSNEVRNMDGHGVGLALARKIIELHKGIIEIDSELNLGTSVIIKLPILKDAVSGNF